MTMLAYDPARLDSLRVAMGAAVDDLLRMHSDDLATATTMRLVRTARASLADFWLPRIGDVLHSQSMTGSTRPNLNDGGGGTAPHAQLSGPLWNMTEDPGWHGPSSDPVASMYGPELPGSRSFGQVIEGMRSGGLHSMTPPLDANGRAGTHYSSISIAPAAVREVGHADLTSDMAKVADFFSDGLPIAWREHTELTILYLTDARLVNGVYNLEAYDRDTGPEPLPGHSTEATSSGYLVLHHKTGTLQVSVRIGPGEQDPTQSFPIISESSSEYSGEFFPDSPPQFHPITHPSVGSPPAWTFTTSASPMADGWGTYGL
ncbi:MAG: hypothetical protein QOJ74_1148 [Ilumatobacteraceae bacterium]|jgi:hypothetical protein|nr:hypothetical protein [Ilumatobacteraceae bacterium]